ncbi:hAT dimerization domain-containing transposase-related protein [Tanacetum coccineum]|uniref:HAT dimerization domain-containing transposase-related protein n=1 Tax=Tanacetum coccineum TaxID=301880 RepID=A0ABQ5BI10_9ASTR
MNLCVNSKLGTIFIGAKDCSDKAHTSDLIFEYVDRCIEDVGPENVVQVVTDNASNNMGAAKLLHEKRPKIFWTSCASHTINLMLEDYELQDLINTVELPKYNKKLEKFDLAIATTSCVVNNEKFDPANWWESYGDSAPNLRKIATRILSLTTSSSGCERIWSIFEGGRGRGLTTSVPEVVLYVCTVSPFGLTVKKGCIQIKRNRLEVAEMNNLIYVQANGHLIKHDKKRNVRNREILIGEDASEAQEWIVDGNDAHWEAVGDSLGVEDELRPRKSARRKERELFEDDFVSGGEGEVDEEVEYESDGAQIMEQYGQDEN